MINFKKFTTKLKFSINFECMKPKFLKIFRNPNKNLILGNFSIKLNLYIFLLKFSFYENSLFY